MIEKTRTIAALVCLGLLVAGALPATERTAPLTTGSVSGACTFQVAEGWKVEQGSKLSSPRQAEAGFVLLVPATWPWEGASDLFQPFIQVSEMPGPVPSAKLMRELGPEAGTADVALGVVQRLAAERGLKVLPTKKEMRDISGRLAYDVGAKGPEKDGPIVMEMVLILAEEEDSWFGVVIVYHQETAERCERAFSQVVNSLRPVRAVPRSQSGDVTQKMEYMAEVLKKGNATQAPPWNMAVLGLALWPGDPKSTENTLLVHLRFLNPNCRSICLDWVKVLGFIKNGTDFEATESRSQFTRLMSAHAGALALEVPRQDIEVSKAIFVIYGENQDRVAAFQTSLDTYRRVLQNKGGGGEELFDSWSSLAGEKLTRLPLPAVRSILPSKENR